MWTQLLVHAELQHLDWHETYLIIYVNMQLMLVDMQHNYVNMQQKKLHVNIIMFHVHIINLFPLAFFRT